MNKIQHLGLGVLFLTLFVGCSKTKEQEIPVESVSLSQPTAEMIIGETAQLNATVLPSNATEKTVLWTSSKQSVATVSSSGLVTAIAEGTSSVTASAGGKSATCLVTVSKGVVAVTSISINKTELVISKGQSETLTATVKPDDATDKTVTWDISNTAIATIDSNGKVTAVSGGDATITAKAGNQVATCALTVTVPVESVSLDKESITLEEESTTTLVATVKPDDATDKSVTWSSSNTSIATVDQSGKVTAVKEGSATITARASNKQATCSVTVKKKVIAVTSVTLNKTELSLNKGQSETLTATVKPDNATDKSVTWSSSNTAVATVDSNGKVTAVAGGNATITAKAGDQQATCAVTVSVPLESISLNKTELALNKGQSETLTATVKPDDATDKTVTWSSSNENVAFVDAQGKVTAVSGGNATITAKAGDKHATCAVTVTVPVESITLDRTSVNLVRGESITLIATVYPSDATDKKVLWNSSNDDVASVDQSGVVSGQGQGVATIKARIGNHEAYCSVEVLNKETNGPVIESFTFSPETINVTDAARDVKVSIHATDESGIDESRLPSVTIYYPSNSNSNTVTKSLSRESGTNKDGVYSVTITIPQGKTPGEWTVYSTVFYDIFGNTSGSHTWSTHDCKQKLTVINESITDTNGPVIESFTFSPETINVTDAARDVKVSIHATDESGIDESRLPSVTIYYPSNSNSNTVTKSLSRESGTNKDGVYSVTITIPQGKTPGEWTVYSTVFYDIFGNTSGSHTWSTHDCKQKLIVISN